MRLWLRVAGASLGLTGFTCLAAAAVPDPDLGAPPRAGAPPPEIVLSNLGPGHGITGQIGPAGSVSDPSVPYPPNTAGFTPLNESFAGIILATPQGGGPALQMYCINIRTPTAVGFGYDLGTWGEANVNNVGFVARLLNDYYPNGNPPLPLIGVNGVNSEDDQAAAVQAAIWYFSDNYVVAANNPLQPAVAGIVNDVRLAGPLPAPAPPTLQISPATTTGDAGTVLGPFVVSTSDPAGAEVTATGAAMFADPGATVPIANGTLVPSGTEIFLQSATPGSATLTAVAEAEVPSGNVYLYNGNINGVNDAQKLILAQTTTVTANAQATATFTQPTTTTSTTTTTTTTTTAPTTTEPESTTTEPESTTTEPESTTTEPESTTTEPESTTTEPGTTTTVATTTTAASPTSLAATTTVVGTSLPGTGRNARPATAAGLLLVGAGLLTLAASRGSRYSQTG
jgi:TQXA domain-containing protein